MTPKRKVQADKPHAELGGSDMHTDLAVLAVNPQHQFTPRIDRAAIERSVAFAQYTVSALDHKEEDALTLALMASPVLRDEIFRIAEIMNGPRASSKRREANIEAVFEAVRMAFLAGMRVSAEAR